MVYCHGVLADNALPVLVGELLQVLATRHRTGVEPGAETFHGGRLAHGHGRFHALPQHPDVVGMRKIIVINERILVRVVGPEQYPSAALGPKHHREHAEHVLVVQVAQQLVVKIVPQTVGLLAGGAAVGVGRRGRQHELYVRPIVRLIAVLGGDEGHRLQADRRRQWALAQHGVPEQITGTESEAVI